MTERKLNSAQHARLDQLANDRPGAKVIGWNPRGGPIIRGPSGRTVWCNPLGRLAKYSA